MSDSNVIGKHTPGPWEKDRYGDLRNPDGRNIYAWSSGICNAFRSPETEANAKLISAAPCLLEALEEALGKMEFDEERIEGEWGACRSLDELEKDGDLDSAIIKARAAIAKAKGLAQ